jgi:hypothetical protein
MSRAHTAWCGDLISIIGATDFGHRFHALMDDGIFSRIRLTIAGCALAEARPLQSHNHRS